MREWSRWSVHALSLAASWRNTIGSCVCLVPPASTAAAASCGLPLPMCSTKPWTEKKIEKSTTTSSSISCWVLLHPLQHLLSQARSSLLGLIERERGREGGFLLAHCYTRIEWKIYQVMFLFLFIIPSWSDRIRCAVTVRYVATTTTTNMRIFSSLRFCVFCCFVAV